MNQDNYLLNSVLALVHPAKGILDSPELSHINRIIHAVFHRKCPANDEYVPGRRAVREEGLGDCLKATPFWLTVVLAD